MHRVLLLPALLTIACSPAPNLARGVEEPLPVPAMATADAPFEPIPRELDLEPRWVELGRRLFADPRLSRDGSKACVDCHALERGGVVPDESRSNHPADYGGPYNVPTVFNVAFNFRLNWQGNFETLEAHVGGPMMNPQVMDAGSWPELVARLAPYEQDFVRAGFPEGPSEEAIREVLAEYQRSLVTPDSRFDRHLRGEEELPEEARRGYARFRSLGCSSCHQGINLGGNLFQRYGVVADPYAGREIAPRDQGRFLVTGEAEDEFVFRVPSLRNVAVTAPYFHDGHEPSLEGAVREMGRVQLGYELSDAEAADIVAFLETLTGAYDGVPLSDGAP